MDVTKIKLSTTELSLVTNHNFILTKNAVVGKVAALLGLTASQFANNINQYVLPIEAINSIPKIAKGENYQGLPWLMLDYPRFFSKQDVFAIRVFFWWGNFISITLQLSGKYQQAYEQNIIRNLVANPNNNWQLCCNEDAWQHNFNPNNYRSFSSFTTHELASLPFIKLAKKIPLRQWDDIDIFLQENFKTLLGLLAA